MRTRSRVDAGGFSKGRSVSAAFRGGKVVVRSCAAFLALFALFGALLGSEPLFIRSSEDAAASPYDNLRVGMPLLTDCVMDREWFCIGFSRERRQPLWVQYRLLDSEARSAVATRSNDFRRDPYVPESPRPEDYARSGFDRGHMAPAADMRWSQEAMSDSFLMTNMSPQAPRCNRGLWKKLEEQVREWALEERALYVVCEPIFRDSPATIARGTIPVPAAYFKIVYDVTPPRKMIAFVIPNEAAEGDLRSFAISVEEAEKATGFDFFNLLPEKEQRRLESRVSVESWTWKDHSRKRNTGKR